MMYRARERKDPNRFFLIYDLVCILFQGFAFKLHFGMGVLLAQTKKKQKCKLRHFRAYF